MDVVARAMVQVFVAQRHVPCNVWQCFSDASISRFCDGPNVVCHGASASWLSVARLVRFGNSSLLHHLRGYAMNMLDARHGASALWLSASCLVMSGHASVLCQFRGFAMHLMLRAMVQVFCGSAPRALYDLAVFHCCKVCDNGYPRQGTGALKLSAPRLIAFGNAQGCLSFVGLRWICP